MLNLHFNKSKTKQLKRRDIFNNLLTSLNQWKIQQKDKLQQIYDQHYRSIQAQREVLTSVEMKLVEELERNARQPIEQLQHQQNVNVAVINQIEETIKKVREENANMKVKLVTPAPPIDVAYDPFNVPSVESDHDQPTKKRKLSLTNEDRKELRGYPYKRLVSMFLDNRCAERNKENIRAYIQVF